jgi:hypothetical protein
MQLGVMNLCRLLLIAMFLCCCIHSFVVAANGFLHYDAAAIIKVSGMAKRVVKRRRKDKEAR